MQTQIKDILLQAGFPLVGFVGEAQAQFGDWYKKWLERGYQAEMAYMERNLAIRETPLVIEPWAKSMVVVGVPYKTQPPKGWEQKPPISCYAWGEDYHHWIKKRLRLALSQLSTEIPGFIGRALVDSAPIPEKLLAQRAGLGWIGKNSLLIHPKYGSYLFLAAVVTNLELESSQPLAQNCGDCALCLDACPNSAIKPRGFVDARLCISYLTIEKRGEFKPGQERLLAGSLFGCDRCQEVCPVNIQAPIQTDSPFCFDPKWSPTSPQWVLDLDLATFDQLKIKSSLKRAGLKGLQRNARAVLAYK